MRMTDGFAELIALRHVDELRMLCAKREAEQEGRGAAYRALVAFGHQLFDEGRENLMSATYDATVERYGYRGVYGASPAWTGIGQWYA